MPAAATATTWLVAAAVAPVNAEPNASSEQASQSLAGHVAVVLEAHDSWRRVRLRDGYEGWMHEGYLGSAALSPEAVRDWSATARLSLGCTIRSGDARIERTLPLGALVPTDAEIIAGEALDEPEIRRRHSLSATELCASAARYFRGTSYQWGGVTPWGADCSGMVQAVFGLHGAAMPRDAREQAALGTPLPLSPGAWRPGDLLFFSDRADGRITHVALVAPQRTLMHVAIGRGGFAVEHLDGTTDSYTAALMGRLKSARRML